MRKLTHNYIPLIDSIREFPTEIFERIRYYVYLYIDTEGYVNIEQCLLRGYT